MAANNATILDAIWDQGSNDYQQRVPRTTQAGISATMAALEDPNVGFAIRNEFQNGLINRMGNTVVRKMDWGNPLSCFKKEGLLPSGVSFQEVSLGLIKAKGYDIEDSNVFQANPLEAFSVFHHQNRQDRYDITISEAELKQAFLSEYGLNEFLVEQLGRPALSAAYDEYRIMLELIAEAEAQHRIHREEVHFVDSENPTAEELKKFSRKLRTVAKKMCLVPSGMYNTQHVPTVSKPENLVILTTPEMVSALDVEVLADAFNTSRTDFVNRVIEIDEFPFDGAYALIIDMDWFIVSDTNRQVTNFVNGKNLTQNFYLHVWQILSISGFANATLFSEATTSPVPVVNVKLESIAAKFLDANGATVTTYSGDGRVDFVVTATGSITPETRGFIVPDAFTTSLTLEDANGKAIRVNDRSFVDRLGRLYLQGGLPTGAKVTVVATSTYVDPSGDGSKPTDPVTATATLTIA